MDGMPKVWMPEVIIGLAKFRLQNAPVFRSISPADDTTRRRCRWNDLGAFVPLCPSVKGSSGGSFSFLGVWLIREGRVVGGGEI